jgi:thioredoxin 1
MLAGGPLLCEEYPTRGPIVATVDLTAADFEKTVLENDIVLVDFWASWCGPCRQFAPTYEKASEANDDVVFGKVDTEAEQELAAAASISSIPTLMAFRDGILVFSQPGALPAPALDQVIGAVRELDMDEVRAQVEAQGKGGQAG